MSGMKVKSNGARGESGGAGLSHSLSPNSHLLRKHNSQVVFFFFLRNLSIRGLKV